MATLTPFPLGEEGSEEDVARPARQLITTAINQFEQGNEAAIEDGRVEEGTPVSALDANALLMKGDLDAVIALRDQYDQNPSPELAESLNRAYRMQGYSLKEQASANEGEDADHLFAQAAEKYEQALTIDPNDSDALSNWGVALDEQGQLKTGHEAHELFERASKKYEQALSIDPEHRYSILRWSNTLIHQARTSTGERADRLLARAEEMGMRADEIRPGWGAYNLACISALRGDEEGAHSWLEKSKASGQLPSRRHVQGDSDLDNLRQTGWFKPTFPIWLNIPLSKSAAFFKPLSICETLAVGMAIITP